MALRAERSKGTPFQRQTTSKANLEELSVDQA